VRRCLRDPTFSCFDTIPECDRHTDTHRQTTTAYTALSIASLGKNHQILWQTLSRVSRLMSMSNFGKIGQSVEMILRFFNFSKWQVTPSWIFETAKFYWLLGRRGSRHISMPDCQNRSIGCEDIKIFSVFQDGGRRHVGLSNSQNFIR